MFFWNKIASLYDFFETVYNGKVYNELGKKVAEHVEASDHVLECACGTGAITHEVAPHCQRLIATDFAEGMLRQAKKKCAAYANTTFCKADIMHLNYAVGTFDKVIAGNVIHLLDSPQAAINELLRVCKPGGKVIIPTYVNIAKNGKPSLAARFLEMLGLDFKRQFDYDSYRQFFTSKGYADVHFQLIEGRMPCAVAIIEK